MSADLAGLIMGFVITLITLVFTAVITIVSVAVPLGLMFFIFRALQAAKEVEQKLIATGTRAPATIESIRETGVTVNDRPQVELSLLVAPIGGAEFRVKHKGIISLLQIPRFQPNNVIEVAYDPEKPHVVAIIN